MNHYTPNTSAFASLHPMIPTAPALGGIATHSELSMAAGAFPFLLGRVRACDSVLSGAAGVGIFCLLDWRVEGVESDAAAVALGLLLSLGTAAAFRLRVVGAVVEDGSAVSIAVAVAFEEEVVVVVADPVAAGTPDDREAWATWRAEDLVILGDMSVNTLVRTVGRCAFGGWIELDKAGQAAFPPAVCVRGSRGEAKGERCRQPSQGVVEMEMCRSGQARLQVWQGASWRPNRRRCQVTSTGGRVGGGREEKKKWPRRACGRKKWNGARRGNEHR